MKRLIFIILSIVLLLITCKKPEIPLSTIEIKNDTITATATTVFIKGDFVYQGKIDEIKLLLSEKSEMTNPNSYATVITESSFSVEVKDLKAKTPYYYCYSIDNGFEQIQTEVATFTTEDYSLAVVTTKDVSNIGATTATCGGNVTEDGESQVTARGVCWNISPNPTIADSHTTNGSGKGEFTSQITDLTPNTKYYVRTYATNAKGTAYGEEKNFTTQGDIPTVTTNDITDITSNTAACGGNVVSDGGLEITACGVCWSTNPNPDLNDSYTTDDTGIGKFTSELTELEANTKYYVRAYATNSKGVAYGSQKTFTTTVGLPTVTTNNPTNITYNSATSGGNVTNSGGGTVTARGVCWNTSPNPTTTDFHTTNGSGIGTFTSSLTNLIPATTYYVRVYATNSAGTAYGNEYDFTTEDGESPTVTTNDVSNITGNSATCGGNVTSDGGLTVTARGVCWSTSQNPTTSDQHTTDGSGTGSFTSQLTDLEPNTTYYVRAYATNSKSRGVAYGSQKTFTTSGAIPTVTTNNVTNITTHTATCGGNVTDDGGTNVTAKGVCWSTNQNPTVSDLHTNDGSGSGSFTSLLTDLEPNTVYHVRAYAINENGTAYGEQKTFTTIQGSIPVVTTSNVTGITSSSAICGGNVISDGGLTVTFRGVCWSTSSNPTTADPHTTDGSGTGEFTSQITDLEPSTTYYVRAYATNSKSRGVAYGEQKTFTTDAELPTVTTNDVINITTNSATCGGNVTSDGGADVTAKGVCWSTSPNPTISNSHTTDGSGSGSFTSNITNLSNGITYYVRAYATNSEGTAYGNEHNFTTGEGELPIVTTNNVTNITTNSATCGGNVINDGGLTVTSRGVCWSTSQNPTTSDPHTTDGSGTGSFTSQLTDLEPNTTYYVRAYATNSKSRGVAYGEQKTFTTDNSSTEHEYVDLGLPSGLKWATCNVGATNPEDYGNYYAWGEIETKSSYDEENCITYGVEMDDISGNPQYDAARANWEGTWRMPTKAEFEELLDECTWTWTTQSGTNGYRVTGPNSNSIFLPAAGYRIGTSLDDAGTGGSYWSSTPSETNPEHAFHLFFRSSDHYTDWHYRYYGHTVRPVTGDATFNELPEVSTSEVSNISTTSATCGGNVTSDGGNTVTARGVCWSTNQNPTTSDSHTTDGSGLGEFTSEITDLEPNTTYYVRAYATNSKSRGVAYGEQKSFTTPGGQINGYLFVDLGLPSGLKWATCNIGATNPEEYGNYYAWGEIEPKSSYDDYNCNMCGVEIGNISGNPQYDAARANWGGTWRMPTKAEFEELIEECQWNCTTQGEVNGYKVIGPNGNSIFFPTAGYWQGSSYGFVGEHGAYWSSTPDESDTYHAYSLFFYCSYYVTYWDSRYAGQSVRPVSE